MPTSLTNKINENIYVKDPESSELGRSIIKHSIDIIHKNGFEEFTFQKLGKQIGSPESTIYRYFQNKHKLLIYLTAWYWNWLEYRLVFATANIKSPAEQLKIALKVLCEPLQQNALYKHINYEKLHDIIVAESSKAYHTKNVDDENKMGYFMVYKRIVGRISEIILKVNPRFKYPRSLVSSVMESIHHQQYFLKHLPSLTDVKNSRDDLSVFVAKLVFSMASKQ